MTPPKTPRQLAEEWCHKASCPKEADRIAGDDKTFDSRWVRKAAGALALAIRDLAKGEE